MLSTLSVEDVCSAGVLVRIKGKLHDLKQTMTTRTAMLWLQYLDMVSILLRGACSIVGYYARVRVLQWASINTSINRPFVSL